MNNKMLHRGSMARLTSTMNNSPVISTCILLLIHFQIFHALPASSLLSSNSDLLSQDTVPIIKAPSTSSVYGSAFPYSSYRPGARLENSYRPYRPYAQDPSSSPSSDVYVPEAIHPNSVYSGQQSSSSPVKNLDKALQLIEKEIQAGSDLQQQQKENKNSFLVDSNTNQDVVPSTPEQKQISSLLVNKKSHNNKPRLLPLPSVETSYTRAQYESNNDRKQEHQNPQHSGNNNDQTQQQQQQPNSQSAHTSPSAEAANSPTNDQKRSGVEFSPMPPPFAPELDPQYERRQYGLGALSLLDQAGPFW